MIVLYWGVLCLVYVFSRYQTKAQIISVNSIFFFSPYGAWSSLHLTACLSFFFFSPCSPVFVPSRDMTEVMINSTPMEDMRLSPSKDRLSFQVGHTRACMTVKHCFCLNSLPICFFMWHTHLIWIYSLSGGGWTAFHDLWKHGYILCRVLEIRYTLYSIPYRREI